MKKIPSLENDQPNDTCNRGCYICPATKKVWCMIVIIMNMYLRKLIKYRMVKIFDKCYH